jgi:hypothetical protein
MLEGNAVSATTTLNDNYVDLKSTVDELGFKQPNGRF